MAKKIFISYSHVDSRWLDRLHKHLAQLRREGSIEAWYDREITAGGKLHDEIARELGEADIFIAALSPDFIASSYCYDVELQEALRREVEGGLVVVPIVFEPCDWLSTPLSNFKALPDEGKPVSEFANENVALLAITGELRRILLKSEKPSQRPVGEEQISASAASRYRIKKDFDRIDKRDFINKSFDEIRNFFKNSVIEINSVPELEADFLEKDKDSFSCTIINRGLGRAFETVTVRRGGVFGEIDLVYGDRAPMNTSHGGFTVQSDDYEMFFSGGNFRFDGNGEKKLSALNVAQSIWDELLRKIGVDYA